MRLALFIITTFSSGVLSLESFVEYLTTLGYEYECYMVDEATQNTPSTSVNHPTVSIHRETFPTALTSPWGNWDDEIKGNNQVFIDYLLGGEHLCYSGSDTMNVVGIHIKRALLLCF